MEKLKQLYEEYKSSVNKKFWDKSSPYYLPSGFSEWLEDKYPNTTDLAILCGFPTNAELRRKIHNVSTLS